MKYSFNNKTVNIINPQIFLNQTHGHNRRQLSHERRANPRPPSRSGLHPRRGLLIIRLQGARTQVLADPRRQPYPSSPESPTKALRGPRRPIFLPNPGPRSYQALRVTKPRRTLLLQTPRTDNLQPLHSQRPSLQKGIQVRASPRSRFLVLSARGLRT